MRELLRVMKPYYEHAGITIYHADCREVLPLLAGVQLIRLTRPYGVDFLACGTFACHGLLCEMTAHP